MKELLEYIAKSLVNNPDAVSVTEVQQDSERSITLELRVAREDMGKVIGRQGKIARTIRTIMKAAAVKENTRVQVEIVQ
ncbi:MAG: KH domain-containing protein [Oscillospiraceae bacterium]|nr:KH domain-containing protein [Oscillospiraceae bacterium]